MTTSARKMVSLTCAPNATIKNSRRWQTMSPLPGSTITYPRCQTLCSGKPFVGGCIKLFQAHANATGSFCKMTFHPDMERLLSSGNLLNTCQLWTQPSHCPAHSPNTFPQMSIGHTSSPHPCRQNCHLLAMHHRMICHMIFFRVCQHPCELPPLPYLSLLFSWADWNESFILHVGVAWQSFVTHFCKQ